MDADEEDEVEVEDEKAENGEVGDGAWEMEVELLTTTQEQNASEVEVTPHLESLTGPLTRICITLYVVYHCIFNTDNKYFLTSCVI